MQPMARNFMEFSVAASTTTPGRSSVAEEAMRSTLKANSGKTGAPAIQFGATAGASAGRCRVRMARRRSRPLSSVMSSRGIRAPKSACRVLRLLLMRSAIALRAGCRMPRRCFDKLPKVVAQDRQCDRPVPQAIVYHSSSLSLPTRCRSNLAWLRSRRAAAVMLLASILSRYRYLRKRKLDRTDGQAARTVRPRWPDRWRRSAPGLDEFDPRRSALSRSKGAARVLAKAVAVIGPFARALLLMSQVARSYRLRFLFRVILIGAKRNWHQNARRPDGWSDVAGGRLSPTRDELSPRRWRHNRRRYHPRTVTAS